MDLRRQQHGGQPLAEVDLNPRAPAQAQPDEHVTLDTTEDVTAGSAASVDTVINMQAYSAANMTYEVPTVVITPPSMTHSPEQEIVNVENRTSKSPSSKISDKWADIKTTPIMGFVGVIKPAIIAIRCLVENLLTFRIGFHYDQSNISIYLPRFPMRLLPGHTEQCTIIITANADANITVPFTVFLKDASINAETQQQGELHLDFTMPEVQAITMYKGIMNTLLFPPIDEMQSVQRSFVIYSNNCSKELQLDLAVIVGSRLFKINKVQEIKRCDMLKVLEKEALTEEKAKPETKELSLRTKATTKHLCRLTKGNAIKVSITFTAPKLADINSNDNRASLKGSLGVHLIGIGVNVLLEKIELYATVGTLLSGGELFPLKTNCQSLSWVRPGRKEISLKNFTDMQQHIECKIYGQGFYLDGTLNAGDSSTMSLTFVAQEQRKLVINFAPGAESAPLAATLSLAYKETNILRKVFLNGCAGGVPLRWAGMVTHGDTAIVPAVRHRDITLTMTNSTGSAAFVAATVHFNLQYRSVAPTARLENSHRIVPGRGSVSLTLHVDWALVEKARDAVNGTALATVTVLTGGEITRQRILKILREDSVGDRHSLPDQLGILEQLWGPNVDEDPSVDELIENFNESQASLEELVSCIGERIAQIELADHHNKSTKVIADDILERYLPLLSD